MMTMSERIDAVNGPREPEAPNKILVVDDEPALLRLMEFVLSRQGYQLRMTPAELVQAGIADVNEHAIKTYQQRFEALAPDGRVTVLAALEQRHLELPNVPAEVFFEVLLELTQQGYFSDPIYGGNRGKASWKMLGFPGIGGMYADKIAEYRNRPYVNDPVGIEDML